MPEESFQKRDRGFRILSTVLSVVLLAAIVPAILYSQDGRPASWQLSWIDRTGKTREPIGTPIRTGTLRLSPDGKRVALYEPVAGGLSDIWIYDLEWNLRTRLTTDPANEDMPVWSPDGSRLIFDSHRGSNAREYSLYEQPSNGAIPERLLLQNEPGTTMFSRDWSSDGRWLIFSKRQPASSGARDLWVLPLTGDRKPFPYLVDRFNKGQAALSPNSRWLAHTTNESGMHQVVVQPFPDPSGGKWQISTSGGAYPRWRRDGRELYYLDPNGRIIAVSVTTDHNFEIGKTTPLFETSIPFPADPSGASYPYDVAPDGQRFLIAI